MKKCFVLLLTFALIISSTSVMLTGCGTQSGTATPAAQNAEGTSGAAVVENTQFTIWMGKMKRNHQKLRKFKSCLKKSSGLILLYSPDKVT